MEIYVIGRQSIYNKHFSLMINYFKNKSSFDFVSCILFRMIAHVYEGK